MRDIFITPDATDRLNNILDYIHDIGHPQIAEEQRLRFFQYLRNTVAIFPEAGRLRRNYEMYETWIPRTPMVIWYVFDDETVTVVDVWHAKQNRP